MYWTLLGCDGANDCCGTCWDDCTTCCWLRLAATSAGVVVVVLPPPTTLTGDAADDAIWYWIVGPALCGWMVVVIIR